MTKDSRPSPPIDLSEMDRLWSRSAERLVWRRIWAAIGRQRLRAAGAGSEALLELARRQNKLGPELGPAAGMADELKALREECPGCRGALDFTLSPSAFAATALAMRQRAALGMLLGDLRDLLLAMCDVIERSAEMAVPDPQEDGRIGFTSFGALIARTAELGIDQYDRLVLLRARLRGVELGLPPDSSPSHDDQGADTVLDEAALAAELDLAPEPADLFVAHTRSGEFLYELALTGAALSRLASQLQTLTSIWPGVLSDPHPWPRLPISRFWDEVPTLASQFDLQLQMLRTSADRAILQLNHAASPGSDIMRDACLALDWMIRKTHTWLPRVSIEPATQSAWAEAFGPFAGVDLVGEALVSEGAPPDLVESILRKHSLASYDAVRQGKPNPLAGLLSSDVYLLEHLQPATLRRLLDPTTRLKVEARRALATSSRVRRRLTPAIGQDRT